MSEELKAALARIACLEGEIAKRDETIARLEPQLNRAIQANYDLREELAACRVAVENCEVFRAELAAIKAQGVVQWPEADEIMQMAFEEGQPADDASGYCFELEEFDLFIERLMSEVARLNASLVQQASVPDGWRLVTTDWLKRIHRDLDACQKLIWANLRGCDPSYYEDAQERLREIDAMLAAPAAPAADAGLVEALDYQALFDAIAAATSVYANGAVNISVQAFRESLADHRAKGVV